MKLTGETKLFLGIIAVTIVLIAGAIILMSKPSPTVSRADLIPVSTPTKGNPDAKVFLVEFSDFQCPACKAAKPTVDAVVEQYKDKLVFAYRHFPLDQHPFSTKAAAAAEAAKEQGKFWDMYDVLFQNQEQFSDDLFPKLALQLHLDVAQFAKTMADAGTLARIQKDKNYGNAIGISGTPTFYLNGQKLNLTNYDDLKNAVANAVK